MKDNTLLPVHRFNQELLPFLDDIGVPLLKNFGITHFGFSNLFLEKGNTCSMLRVATNAKWNEIYLAEGFYNDILMYDMSSVPANRMRRKILVNEPSTDLEKILYKQNIWNFLLLYERNEDEGSLFFFGTSRDNKKVIDYYINYPEVFEHFVHYFKNKLSQTLKARDRKYIQLAINPFNQIKNEERSISKFYLETEISKYCLGSKFSEINLSKREVESLYYLAQGKTSKEIARELAISPRTVESFINKIRLKTGISNRIELATQFSHLVTLFDKREKTIQAL